MNKGLSYLTLLEFLNNEWEFNHKEARIEIHRNDFVEVFGDVGFEFINRFLRDLDERYRAIRVSRYAYTDMENENETKYMDLTAREIADIQYADASAKDILVINRSILTTILIIEPDFLNILESFRNSWKLKASEEPIVESLITAKLRLKGRVLLLEFENKEVEIWTYRSKKGKNYCICKSLLEAKGEFVPKNGLTASILRTDTNQLPKLMGLDSSLAKIFYQHTKTHAALNNRVELNKPNATIVRGYVNTKIREKRET